LSAFATSREPAVSVAARNQADRLTRAAQDLLLTGDRERAITLLLEGVRVDPYDNSARKLLAVTLAHHASLSRNAERHFLAALDADPGDVDLRYKLALYYKRAGLPKRAMTALRTLLAAAPDHSAAKSLLKSLARRESSS